MRIALVALPKNEVRYPPIGLLRIHSYLKANAKDVELLFTDNTFDDIHRALDGFNPDVIGLTSFTTHYQDALDFSRERKRRNPAVRIVVGGPHITHLPSSLGDDMDFGVMGEGEETMGALVEAIRGGSAFDGIQGLVHRKGGEIVANEKRELRDDLDSLHVLDYGLLNPGYFASKFIQEKNGFGASMGIMASIGCPYKCRFCAIAACWEKIRYRDLGLVVAELKQLHERFGVTHVDFYDDLFAVNKPRLREFGRRLADAGLAGKLSFSCQARANLIDDEMCEILKGLNVKACVFGFESGSDRVLKYIKKDPQLSVETNRRALETCARHGLNVFGCLMMGMPTETPDDMQQTIEFIRFARQKKATRIWMQVLIPFPGTEMWSIAREWGRVTDGKNSWRDINLHNNANPMLLDPAVTLDQFLEKYNTAKKLCRYFVFKQGIDTVTNDPMNALRFVGDSGRYVKKLREFLGR